MTCPALWQFFARDDYSVEYVLSERLLIERREELLKIIMVWRQRVRSTAELRSLVDEGEITEDDLATLNLTPSALEVRARTHLRAPKMRGAATKSPRVRLGDRTSDSSCLPHRVLTGPYDR